MKSKEAACETDEMQEEYDLKKLNPRRNPYAKHFKQQVTINLNISTVNYFKDMAEESGIPYQMLINLYLDDCVKKRKKLKFE